MEQRYSTSVVTKSPEILKKPNKRLAEGFSRLNVNERDILYKILDEYNGHVIHCMQKYLDSYKYLERVNHVE